jgi:hypothetical protein
MSRAVLRRAFEAPFQEAFLGTRLVGGDSPAKRARPSPPVGAVEDVYDRGEVEEPAALGTVDGRG